VLAVIRGLQDTLGQQALELQAPEPLEPQDLEEIQDLEAPELLVLMESLAL
jgi:hypothetical protein